MAWTVAVVVSGGAFAQSTTNPGNVDQRFRPQPAPPSVGSPLDIPAARPQQLPPGAESAHFTLTGVTFKGNTVFSDAQLQSYAARYVGKEITLAQIYELADEVTAPIATRATFWCG